MKFDPSIVKTTFESTLGPMTVAATDIGLAGVWFDDQKHLPDFAKWPVRNDHPVLQAAVQQLEQYFAGQRSSFDLPIDLAVARYFSNQSGKPYSRYLPEPPAVTVS